MSFDRISMIPDVYKQRRKCEPHTKPSIVVYKSTQEAVLLSVMLREISSQYLPASVIITY